MPLHYEFIHCTIAISFKNNTHHQVKSVKREIHLLINEIFKIAKNKLSRGYIYLYFHLYSLFIYVFIYILYLYIYISLKDSFMAVNNFLINDTRVFIF